MRYFFPLLIAVGFSPVVSRADVQLPSGEKLKEVDFERHIMGLLSKSGCNNGSCHGSFQGKNGFRLSLFGLEPDKDHKALTREQLGRRINIGDPDSSLLLQKAAGLTSHDGGARFSKDSWQYNVFREWIRTGGYWKKGSGEVKSIELHPKEYILIAAGESTRIKVTATYSDDSKEDITPFAEYRIQDDAVAQIDLAGKLTAKKPGDSGFVVLYRGQVASARILVPTPAEKNFVYPKIEQVNPIDKEVQDKLRMLNVIPSDKVGDAEFLRRVTIDTTGNLPTPDEVRKFLADPSPNKRERKIDELLKHPLHAAVWATKFSDITGNNTTALEQPAEWQTRKSQMWHEWLRKRFYENMPYDQIVKGIVTATSREGLTPEAYIESVRKIDEAAAKNDYSEYAKRETLDLFWRRQQQVPSNEWGEKVAAAFLGVRLECAQCHKHPTDRWTQADYRSFANIFSAVTSTGFSNPEVQKLVAAENTARREKAMAANAKVNNNQINLVREMYLTPRVPPKNLFGHPETGVTLPLKALGGPELKGADPREELFKWMVSPENPFFARSFVNRVWAHYFGVGLVDPVDDFSLANPPVNSRLLDLLAKEFIESRFDIRKLERQILMSRTYQTSYLPNETNRFDKNNFAKSYVRPMMAEFVVDVLNGATGSTQNFGKEIPEGARMVEVGASRIQDANLAFILRVFGRPPRTTACDCERASEPALPQTLFRMTDQSILRRLTDPNGRLMKLLKEKKDDNEVFEELVLATLSRFPTEAEKENFKKHRAEAKDRTSAFVDTLWALINTREFILQH